MSWSSVATRRMAMNEASSESKTKTKTSDNGDVARAGAESGCPVRRVMRAAARVRLENHARVALACTPKALACQMFLAPCTTVTVFLLEDERTIGRSRVEVVCEKRSSDAWPVTTLP